MKKLLALILIASSVYAEQSVINTFTAGELSPHLDARVDFEKYKSGCRTLENFFVLPYGGAQKRPGTQYIADTKSNDVARLAPFSVGVDQTYIMELGQEYIRFYASGVQITNANGAPLEIATPYSTNDVFEIQMAQFADTMYMVHEDYPVQKLQRTSVSPEFSISELEYSWPPVIEENLTDTTITPSAITGAVTLTASDDVWTTNHVGADWVLRSPNEHGTIELEGNGETPPINVEGDWELLVQNVFAGETLTVQVSEDGGDTWGDYREYGGVDELNYDRSGVESEQGVKYRMIMEGDGGNGFARLKCEEPYINGFVTVTSFISSTEVEGEVKSELGSTNATEMWYEGAFSEERGYPKTVEFFQNRLWFGGTSYLVNTLWASATDDYENFKTGTYDDSALQLAINSDNIIEWLLARNQLFIGTLGGEWILDGGDSSTPVSPTAVLARRQTGFGSRDGIDALIASDSLVYLQRQGRKLREFEYSLESDSYESTDITLLAEHITEGGVVQIAEQQQPEPIVWCVRGDGELVGMTYNKMQNVYGWHRHATKGEFESVAVIPTEGEDEIYVVVKRKNGRFIERFRPVDWGDDEDAWFVDSGLDYDGGDSVDIEDMTVGTNQVSVDSDYGPVNGIYGYATSTNGYAMWTNNVTKVFRDKYWTIHNSTNPIYLSTNDTSYPWEADDWLPVEYRTMPTNAAIMNTVTNTEITYTSVLGTVTSVLTAAFSSAPSTNTTYPSFFLNTNLWYDAGTDINGRHVYHDETDTYALWYAYPSGIGVLQKFWLLSSVSNVAENPSMTNYFMYKEYPLMTNGWHKYVTVLDAGTAGVNGTYEYYETHIGGLGSNEMTRADYWQPSTTNVVIYDTSFQRWWIGRGSGSDHMDFYDVWYTNSNQSATPPSSGWQVDMDGSAPTPEVIMGSINPAHFTNDCLARGSYSGKVWFALSDEILETNTTIVTNSVPVTNLVASVHTNILPLEFHKPMYFYDSGTTANNESVYYDLTDSYAYWYDKSTWLVSSNDTAGASPTNFFGSHPNSITVSGAGDTDVNEEYDYYGISSGNPLYSVDVDDLGGTPTVVWANKYWKIWDSDIEDEVYTNALDTYMPPKTGWFAAAQGTDPAPTVDYERSYVFLGQGAWSNGFGIAETPVSGSATLYGSPLHATTETNMLSYGEYVRLDNQGGLEIVGFGDGVFAVTNCTYTNFTLLYKQGRNVFARSEYTNGTTATPVQNTFTNVSHLKEQEADIYADGGVQPSQTVSSNGVLVTDSYHNRVIAGLPYDARLSPMFIETVSQEGTSYGKVKNPYKVHFRVYESGAFKYGASTNDLYPVTIRGNKLPVGQPVPFFSGDPTTLPISIEPDTDPVIWVVSEDPLPLELLSLTIFTSVTEYE